MGHGLRGRDGLLGGACFTAIFCVAEASECVGVCVCASYRDRDFPPLPTALLEYNESMHYVLYI